MNKKLLHVLGISFVVAFFYSLLLLSGFFRTWQERSSDSLFLPRKPLSDIVIIAIDDTSIQKIGRWPWNRSVHAQLLNILGTNPAVVGYDVSFPEPSTATDDAALADAIKNTRKTILPLEAGIVDFDGTVTQLNRILEPIPELLQVADAGVVNTIAGEDSITRHIPAVIDNPNQTQDEHFSLLLARTYLLHKGLPDSTKSVKDENGLMRINFVGKPGSFTTYPFSDVIDGKVEPTIFKDKIVLIGSTAINLHDNQLTAVSGNTPMAGVEILANSTQTIIENRYLVQEETINTILSIFIASLITGFVMAYFGVLPATIMVVVSLIGYLIYTFLSFDKGIIRNIVFPSFVIISSYIALALYRYFIEYNQRKFLKRAFSLYVSHVVLEEIISNPKKLSLGGVRKEMTVLFADIAGFTSISEKIQPDELSHLLNNYLTRVSRIIFKYNGVIDKFIGDAVMAFWNAPLDDTQHALNACKAAVEVKDECKRMSEETKDENFVPFSVRIGINTGDMIVGNMGSDMRFDYTVLGDNVNLGSRLEAINREYGTKILITKSTYELVHKEVVTRLIDTVAVKGKRKGVPIYELVRMGEPTISEKKLFTTFEQARKCYEKGEFKESLKAFQALLKQWPDDEPSKLYVSRCTQYIANPPAEWDGIYHALTK